MESIKLTEEQAKKICDEYCKYPLTTKTQFELDQVCHDCPMEIREDVDIKISSPAKIIDVECSNCGHSMSLIAVAHDAAVTNQAIDKCIELVRSRYWLTTEQLTEAMEKLKEGKDE